MKRSSEKRWRKGRILSTTARRILFGLTKAWLPSGAASASSLLQERSRGSRRGSRGNMAKRKRKDAPAIAIVEKEVMKAPWPLEVFESDLGEESPWVFLVAEEEGELLGYLDYMVTFDSSTIASLAVRKDAQRKGVATLLLDRMEEELRKEEEAVLTSTLEVRASNEPAKALYRKRGYLFVCRKKGYYEDGEDAEYYVKGLIS